MAEDVMVVGDVIWFSVELLRQMVADQIADYPPPVLVRVKEIRTEADGAKLIVLERTDAA